MRILVGRRRQILGARHNVDIPAQRRQKAHALSGVAVESPPDQLRDFGLVDPEKGGRRAPRELPLRQHAIDFDRERHFDQPLLRSMEIRSAKTLPLLLVMRGVDSSSLLGQGLRLAEARRCWISLRCRCGVAMPCVDFF